MVYIIIVGGITHVIGAVFVVCQLLLKVHVKTAACFSYTNIVRIPRYCFARVITDELAGAHFSVEVPVVFLIIQIP